MDKRSNVTTFIIIGIIILILAVSTIAFREEIILGFAGVLDIEIMPAHNYVEECMSTRAEYGLNLLAAQNSYINVENEHYVDQDTKISYGIYDGQKQLQELESIREELSAYLYDYVSVCIAEYDEISPENVTVGDYSVDVYFSLSTTNIEIRDSFIKKDSFFEKDSPDISVSLPVRFRLIHQIADSITDMRLQEPILTEYIDDLKVHEGIEVTWTRLDGHDIYLIKDYDSALFFEPYIYTLMIE